MIVLQVIPYAEAVMVMDRIPERLHNELMSPRTFTMKLDGQRAVCVRQLPALNAPKGTAPYRFEIVGKVEEPE